MKQFNHVNHTRKDGTIQLKRNKLMLHAVQPGDIRGVLSNNVTHPLVAKCGSHKLEDGDNKQLIASECVTIAYGLEGIVKTFISVHFRYVTT